MFTPFRIIKVLSCLLAIFCFVPYSFAQIEKITNDVEKDKPDKFKNRTLKSEKTGDKKFTLPRRIIQNTVSHYNYYFNANNELNRVIERARIANKDNYAKLLPFYSYSLNSTSAQKSDLDSVIYKATAGILLHDLRSDWVDNFYLLIGRAYLLRKDFDSAGMTFQFINYNLYPHKKDDDDQLIVGSNSNGGNSVSIANKENTNLLKKAFTKPPSRNDALVWQIRTLTESDEYTDAAGLINTLQNDQNFPSRLNAFLEEAEAYWFYKQGIYDSTAFHLEKALPNASDQQEKARSEYLLAQLYERLKNHEKASEYYTKAINHTTDPLLDIYANLSMAKMYDTTNTKGLDLSIATLMKMAKKDKFEPYRDIVFYSAGEIALQKPDTTNAEFLFKKSLHYNEAGNEYKDKAFLELAQIDYKRKKYKDASAKYDSLDLSDTTLADLADLDKIETRRNSLSKIVEQINIIDREDSLQLIALMTPADREAFVKKLAKKLRKEKGLIDDDNNYNANPASSAFDNKNSNTPLFDENNSLSDWYFDNASLKSKGFSDFRSKWGKRQNVDNWRVITSTGSGNNINTNNSVATDNGLVTQNNNGVNNAVVSNNIVNNGSNANDFNANNSTLANNNNINSGNLNNVNPSNNNNNGTIDNNVGLNANNNNQNTGNLSSINNNGLNGGNSNVINAPNNNYVSSGNNANTSDNTGTKNSGLNSNAISSGVNNNGVNTIGANGVNTNFDKNSVSNSIPDNSNQGTSLLASDNNDLSGNLGDVDAPEPPPGANSQRRKASNNQVLVNEIVDISFDGLMNNIPTTEEKLKISNTKISASLFQLGKLYQNTIEDYYSAIETYEKSLKLFPDSLYNGELYTNLSYCYHKTGDEAKANYYKNLLTSKFKESQFAKNITNPAPVNTANKDPKATKQYEEIYNLFIEGEFDRALAEKKIADSLFGETYWNPQLLYIESVYHIREREDSQAVIILSKIINNYPSSPLSAKAANMINVLSRRKEIEAYLTNLKIERLKEDEPVIFDEPTIKDSALNNRKRAKQGVVIRRDSTDNLIKDSSNLISKDVIKKQTPVLNGQFNFIAEDSQRVVMILNKVDPVYISEARNAFNRFNREKYSGQAISIAKDTVDKERNILVFSQFANADEAFAYEEQLKKNAATEVSWLPANKYSFIIISNANLQLLKSNKDLQTYIKILNSRYPGKF